ncbi:MAG: trehalose-phosphatase [Desulfomonilaceae bacterium]|nr:trehalose-phosphatase [Desulfomonilaceae bacterium]
MSGEPALTIRTDTYDAAVFDLDGVITRTARVHAKAWKQMFDEFLVRQREATGREIGLFDEHADYDRYVDGKPRYRGVQSFLNSRNIQLPWGNPGDLPGMETVCGLGNRKNQLYQRLLETMGVETYDPAVQLVKALREAGIKTAVVSSSKNCAAVLEAAHLSDLFETRVDGVELEKLDLRGKPDPDVFLEAARRLGVRPDRTVVFEDAVSGVVAGRDGGFRCVVGVDRKDQAQDLLEAGAHVVVNDLGKVHVVRFGQADETVRAGTLPSALDRVEEILGRARGRRLACFLDYDGTLTPIVDNPQDAVLAEETRTALRKLSRVAFVAIVSGRGLNDVRRMVGLEDVYYAGSHGFEISGPDNIAEERAREYLQLLDAAETELTHAVRHIPGTVVERKKYSVAMHFRKTPRERIGEVEETVDRVIAHHPQLRKSSGKKIFEVQPGLDWDKGKAVLWLMETLGFHHPNDALPLYIGDDTTDEDAFAAIRDGGITIVVDSGQESSAEYRLNDPEEVRRFLESLQEGLP